MAPAAVLAALAGVLAAKVWHYWISWVLLGATLPLVIALGVGYYLRVMSTRPPKQ